MHTKRHLLRLTISKSRCEVGECCGDRKTAVEAAEGLYKQARKRRRAGDQIVPLLEKAQADLAYLE